MSEQDPKALVAQLRSGATHFEHELAEALDAMGPNPTEADELRAWRRIGPVALMRISERDAEIERLRGALAETKESRDYWWGEARSQDQRADAADTELTRLRGALAEVEARKTDAEVLAGRIRSELDTVRGARDEWRDRHEWLGEEMRRDERRIARLRFLLAGFHRSARRWRERANRAEDRRDYIKIERDELAEELVAIAKALHLDPEDDDILGAIRVRDENVADAMQRAADAEDRADTAERERDEALGRVRHADAVIEIALRHLDAATSVDTEQVEANRHAAYAQTELGRHLEHGYQVATPAREEER